MNVPNVSLVWTGRKRRAVFHPRAAPPHSKTPLAIARRNAYDGASYS